MPTSILIVDKTGTIKEQSIKDFKSGDLYKKAAFKNGDGFVLQHTWPVNVKDKKYNIEIYGKTTGRAGQENKYDFPPPVDNNLFFGSCVLVNKMDNGEMKHLTADEWNVIYEYLFGGFDDIGSQDSEDEDEDEEDEMDDIPKTKDGYVKDGFVVDDEEDEEDDDYDPDDEDDDEDDEDEDDEEEVVVQKKKKPVKKIAVKTKPVKKNKKIPENIFIEVSNNSDIYLDCTSELSEESYVKGNQGFLNSPPSGGL